jgi:hypothetical protein
VDDEKGGFETSTVQCCLGLRVGFRVQDDKQEGFESSSAAEGFESSCVLHCAVLNPKPSAPSPYRREASSHLRIKSSCVLHCAVRLLNCESVCKAIVN